MNLVLLSHPTFFSSESMPRFVDILANGMRRRGWNIEIFRPQPYLYRIAAPPLIRKWLGYVDQYLIFPLAVLRKMKHCTADTLFVLADQALGIWVPLVAHRPHLIHCHDFLAQHSARGRIRENPTALSGRLYQSLIHRGYSKGKHFISVSEKTRDDLHSLLAFTPVLSEVVYNGLNERFVPHDPVIARTSLSAYLQVALNGGYVLHVGANQWNKNRVGVIEIYDTWRSNQENQLPLVMVGDVPDMKLKKAYERSKYRGDIHFVVKLADTWLPAAYAGATVFIFPSIAEGFGWPIAEAMACGCPVITTNAAPMTEVASDAAFYIPVRPSGGVDSDWVNQSAMVLDCVVRMSPEERTKVVGSGLSNAGRFAAEASLDRIEEIYKQVIEFGARQIPARAPANATVEI